MKRVILLASAAIIGVTLTASAPAAAHHPELAGSVSRPCGEQAEWSGTVTVRADAVRGKEWRTQIKVGAGPWSGESAWQSDSVPYGPIGVGPFGAGVASVVVQARSDWRPNGPTNQTRSITLNRPEAYACPTPTTTTTTTTSTTTTEPAPKKIDICHRDQGNPEWKIITISENALPAHLAHQWGEDIYPVPEDGCPQPPTTSSAPTTTVPVTTAPPETTEPPVDTTTSTTEPSNGGSTSTTTTITPVTSAPTTPPPTDAPTTPPSLPPTPVPTPPVDCPYGYVPSDIGFCIPPSTTPNSPAERVTTTTVTPALPVTGVSPDMGLFLGTLALFGGGFLTLIARRKATS